MIAENAANRPSDASCALLRGVSRAYGPGRARTWALRDVDLRIRRGERVAVLGPSGAGKSTLLHLLGAMDRADEGRVEVFGRDLSQLDDARSALFRLATVGFVFQFPNLLPSLTALDNVALPARLARRPAGEARERAQALLARVGLADKEARRPDELSGGEQQRVALARALVNEPELILADEPTGALDRATGERVLALLSDLVRERGATWVMATHSDAAAARADRSVHIEDGRVVTSHGAPVS